MTKLLDLLEVYLRWRQLPEVRQWQHYRQYDLPPPAVLAFAGNKSPAEGAALDRRG